MKKLFFFVLLCLALAVVAACSGPIGDAIKSITGGESQGGTPAKSRYHAEDILIIVDKEDNSFAVFAKDASGEYTEKIVEFPCSLGRSDRMTPTGDFEISERGRWKEWIGDEYSPYWTKYTSGLYIHGPIYDDKRNDSLITEKWDDLGKNKTSGCIRTTFEGAKWVYDNCPQRTTIKIVVSSDLVSRVAVPELDPDYPNWDPTDPDKPD